MSSETTDKPNRVWTNPDSEKEKPSIVCLTPEALCLAVVPADDLEKTAATLAAGGEVVVQRIPLSTITQLEGEEGDSTLLVTYQQGEDSTDSVTVTLADSSRRDELLAALRDRLGPTWTCTRRQGGRLSASGWPLGAAAGIAILTWLTYVQAQMIAAGKDLKPVGSGKAKFISALTHWVAGLIGTTGVLVLGGVLAGLCLVWLLYVVARPRIRVTVRPE